MLEQLFMNWDLVIGDHPVDDVGSRNAKKVALSGIIELTRR